MNDLTLSHVDFSYPQIGQQPPKGVRDISVAFARGRLTALVGENGSGKSTCLKLAAGLLSPQKGQVRLGDALDNSGGDKKDAFADTGARARHIAYLPQFQPLLWSLLCRDIVALGRLPHACKGGESVSRAMADCDVADFADTPIDALSGGEQARVLLARALAGDADFYLLDEPVRSLDLRRQIEILTMLRGRATQSGKGVVVVLHDLAHAARFCDDVLVLKHGRPVAYGSPDDVFTPTLLRTTFGVEAI